MIGIIENGALNIDSEKLLNEMICTESFEHFLQKIESFVITKTWLSEDFEVFTEILNKAEGDILSTLYELNGVKLSIEKLTLQQQKEFDKINVKIDTMNEKIDEINEKYHKLDKRVNITLTIVIFFIIITIFLFVAYL